MMVGCHRLDSQCESPEAGPHPPQLINQCDDCHHLSVSLRLWSPEQHSEKPQKCCQSGYKKPLITRAIVEVSDATPRAEQSAF